MIIDNQQVVILLLTIEYNSTQFYDAQINSIQEMMDPKEEITTIHDLQLQPLVLFNTVDPAVLVVEKRIICSVLKPENIPIALLDISILRI